MARHSGLASEHHPQGPGDAPRRRKSRKNTPSIDLSHGSKRPASPSPDVSTPKRKRVNTDDHDQLEREIQESASRSQSQAPDVVVLTHAHAHAHKGRHARRASEPVVAFADYDEDESDRDDAQLTPSASTQPLPGLTPHLQRIGAPSRGRPTKDARRARMSMPAQIRIESPVDEASGSQIQFAPFKATIDSRTRRRLKRNHYAEEFNELEEQKKDDKKLRKAYIELNRLLAEKNNTIRDLEFQIEARRMGDISLTDDETEKLRAQLAQAQQEIEDLRASDIYRGDSRETSTFDAAMDGQFDDDNDDDDDDEPLLAIDPADPDGPNVEHADPLPNGEFATRVMALSSQVTVDSLRTMTQTSHDSLVEASQADPASVPDKISDQAVKRFETEIERLTELIGEAQGAIRIVAISLQNLNVLQPGASTDAILAELRRAFEALREEMENLLPGSTAGLTNGELLRKIPTLFEGLLTELREKTTAAETYHQEARVMRSQYENTLDLLERSEARNDDLDLTVADLEQANEQQRIIVADLEERVTTLDVLVDQQDTDLKQKDIQMHGLQDELDDKETALTRIRDSLEKYRAELDSVTKTATEMEEQYRQTIADMEQQHDAAVLDLQAQLQDENEARLQAEGEAEQKSEYIEELQEHVQEIENSVNAMTEDLEQLRHRLATETHEHDQTKTSLDGETAHAQALASTIEALEAELQQLKAELEDTRANLETESTLREQAEASLADANRQIEELKENLHQEGLESQSLRSKLFEVQMAKETAIKKLEEDAQERETALQESLDAETRERETGDQTIVDLELRITQLEDDIAVRDDEIARLAQSLADTEKDRDEHVSTLSTQLADLKQKYAALENTSNSTIASLQANITDLTNEVNAQKVEIERISAEANDTERGLQEELAEKNRQIVELQDDLSTSRDDYDRLEQEHTQSIERFSEETHQFVKVQDKFIREQKALTKKAGELEARIRDLEAAAAQRTLDHEAAIQEKDAEIQELHILSDTRAETIFELQNQANRLKDAFAAQEKDTRETIDQLIESQRALQQQNEDLAASLKKRNAETLEAMQALQVKGVEIKSKTVDLHKVANGKIAKVNERVKIGKKGRKLKERKWRDSGIGADSDIENEDVSVDAVAPEGVVG